MKYISIPRVSRDEFHAPRWGGEPRVILNNVPGWPAYTRWQPGYLKSVGTHHEIVVKKTRGSPGNFFQGPTENEILTFAEYIGWVTGTADRLDPLSCIWAEPSDIVRAVSEITLPFSYYLSANLSRLPATLKEDITSPIWYRTEPTHCIMWCGILGTSCGLHFDGAPNCNVQVVGRKHFILFPPKQSGLLYRRSGESKCSFDPVIPDFEQFPLAQNSTAWHCTLEPGESLFIPVGWYHQVTAVSPWALNVNFFWRASGLEVLAAPNLWHFALERGLGKLRRLFDVRTTSRLRAH